VRKPYEPTPLPGPSAFDPGRRGVKALACVAVVIVLAAAYLAWQARSRPETVGPTQESVATGAAAQIVVAVSGRVQRPGLVRLPTGARVADAIEAAGGALPGTDLSSVNLARKLTDGELIAIGVDLGATPGGKVSLNAATLAQLDALPGVGPVLAQRIIDFRTQHGGFRSVNELRQVDGIGDETFARLKELVVL
jgi:competence protein ComEA